MNKIIVDVKGLLTPEVEYVLVNGIEIEVVRINPRDVLWVGEADVGLGELVDSAVAHRYYDEAVGAAGGEDADGDDISEELTDILMGVEAIVLWDEPEEVETVSSFTADKLEVVALCDISVLS